MGHCGDFLENEYFQELHFFVSKAIMLNAYAKQI